jgi:hypothetical protein
MRMMMMKRLALVLSFLAVTIPTWAHGADRGEDKATVAGKAVSVDYGRPSLKGRDMMAQAEVDKPWRLGADAATTLKTEADLSFGAAAVPKGEYILTATKLAEDKWQLTVARADKTKVAEIPLKASKLPASVEILTIEVKGEKEKGEFSISWGTTALKADFSAK